MHVTVLGSGTAIPVPDRFPAGYLVRGAGRHVLVDLGPGTLRRLSQAGVGPDQLDAVLLTHFHTDHCADLAALLFALRSPVYADRPPLRVLAAPGLGRLVRNLTDAWPWLQPKGYDLQLEEIGPGDHRVGDLQVHAIPIRHTAQSLGYRIGDGSGVAAFSGDADECEELVALARAADLFVCDAAFPDERYTEGHLTPGRAGGYAARAGARRLVLTHFYPECEGVDLRAQAAARFEGAIELAEDLRTYLVGEPGASGAGA